MAFYSPDIVKLALAGGSIENLKTIAQVKQPPVVFIINTPLKTEKEEIKVTLKIEDQGGGIGDIRLYLNGTSVMLNKAKGVAIKPKILYHAVGSIIISASTALQEVLEGYQGHGLFAYVLTEGLKGRTDTDRDRFIKTLELATYVDAEVPALAEKVFKRAQYPAVTPTGQAFPVGKAR